MEKNLNNPVLVTPDLAKEWLGECNTHNRKVYKDTVVKYARDMSHGTWILSNQGIGFNKDGVLIDGQHRLLACIMANVPFLTYVMRGLSPDAQSVIDCQKKRTIGDQLHLCDGLENANLLVAIANCIVLLIKGSVSSALSVSSAREVINLYKEETIVILDDAGQIPSSLKFTPVIAGFVIVAKTNIDKTIIFKNKYFKGNNLCIDDPMLTLRNYILARNKGTPGARGYRRLVMEYTLQALMYAFQDKQLKTLRSNEKALYYFFSKQRDYIDLIRECISV